MPKDTWNNRINMLYLSRLEEKITFLCRHNHYAEALSAAGKAYEIARKIFGQDHPRLKTYLNNITYLQKMSVTGDVAKIPENKTGQIDNRPVSSRLEHLWRRMAKRGTVVKFAVVIVLIFLVSAGFNSRSSSSGNGESLSAYALSSYEKNNIPLYRVKAAFNPAKHTLEGEEEVVFYNTRDRNELAFNLYFNRYSDAALDSSEIRKYAFKRGSDRGYIEVTEVIVKGKPASFRQDGQILRIGSENGPFTEGENKVQLRFKVKIPYISDRSGGDTGGIWLGNWLPTIMADNSPNQPTEVGDPFINMSSTYETEFILPKEFRLVLSNTYSVEEKGNTRVYKSRLERVRDLPVFLNGNYQEAVVKEGETEIHYYYRSAISRPDEVLRFAKKSLAFYKGFLGEYPWKQLNIVENDMYLNGMEYSTLLLLSSKAIGKSLEETVFHEIGHQWFYNIVGSDQYKAPYIDEGLVDFTTRYALGRTAQRYQDDIKGLNRDLSEFQTWQKYREVHYHNGRKLFDNLYLLLGKTEFENLIKEYYHRYEFSFVTPEEFKKFLTEKIGEKSVTKLMQ